MNSRPSSLPCSDRRGGFSLVELLVTIGVMSVVMTGVVGFFSMQAKRMREHSFRIETQQALRGTLDAITRDVRLAGACLPGDGQFIALAGSDSPDGDMITVRTGMVRNDMSCVFGVSAVAAAAGVSTVTVDKPADLEGFEVGQLAYMRDPNGGGELRRVAAVGANSVTLDAALTQNYPAGSSVYAVDERVYTLDRSVSPTVLVLQVNRGEPQAFAAGINALDFWYVLNRNCPTCDTVDLSAPLSTADWWLVNEVIVRATAESVGTVIAADETTMTQVARAKPRNLF